MALTFGYYLAPERAQPLAVTAVVILVAVNLRGVERTAQATRVILALVITALAVTVAATLIGNPLSLERLASGRGASVTEVLQAAGFFFFAFAGYARLATLGEEVRDPSRIIPRAIPLALGLVLAVYLIVAVSSLLAVGPATLAATNAPLAAAVGAGSLESLDPIVRIGAAIASLGCFCRSSRE